MDLRFIKYIWQSNYILQVKTRVITSINTMARQQQGWKFSLKEGISIFFTSLVERIAIAMSLIILSVIFLYFEWEVPGYIENTTFLLTYTTIFLVLMSLGIALTRLKVVSWSHASILGGVRVIIGPIIGYALIRILNLDGFAAGVLLIQSAMPSAVLTYLVGSMYSKKRAVDNVASVIVTSTLMSFISAPIIVYISLRFFQ